MFKFVYLKTIKISYSLILNTCLKKWRKLFAQETCQCNWSEIREFQNRILPVVGRPCLRFNPQDPKLCSQSNSLLSSFKNFFSLTKHTYILGGATLRFWAESKIVFFLRILGNYGWDVKKQNGIEQSYLFLQPLRYTINLSNL